ncbi:MAG: hypothetical protein WKF87_06825 [Chryseolinea sp.]
MEALSASDVQTIQSLSHGGPAAAQAAQTPEVVVPVIQPGAIASPDRPGEPAGEPGGEEEEELHDISEFGFESLNDMQEYINRSRGYEKQISELSEYKAGPKFASDRQKHLYDFASKFEGMELSMARQLLEVVDLDLKSLPDQRARFEAFRLSPSVKGLSQDEMYQLFMDSDTKQFGSSQDEANPQTPIQKILERQATAQAKETLAKMQGEWNTTRTAVKSPDAVAQEQQEYRQHLSEELSDFDGIQLSLEARGENGEIQEGQLNFRLDPVRQRRAVVEALADPAGWWDRKLEEMGIMSPGQQTPDFEKFAQLVTQYEFQDELRNMAYQQGYEDQLARQLATARNVSDPARGQHGMVDPANVTEKQDANRQAMKVAGII